MIKTSERILKTSSILNAYMNYLTSHFQHMVDKLAEAIEGSVYSLNATERAILTNQYILPKRERINRKQFCADNNIVVKGYITEREQALLNFYKCYLMEIESLYP